MPRTCTARPSSPCGVVLFVFILLINLCFSAVKRKADAT